MDMKRLAKRALGSRLLKRGVVVAAVGVGAYEIHKEWGQVHHALGTICLVTCLWALLARLLKLASRPRLAQPLTGRVLARALAWAFVAWGFNGLQIFLMAEKFGAPVGKTILVALGGYAFAWCVGFVIVIAPAGAGVR